MCDPDDKCIYETRHISTRAIGRYPDSPWYLSGEAGPLVVRLSDRSQVQSSRSSQYAGIGGSVIAGVGYEGKSWGILTGINLFKTTSFFPLTLPIPILELRHYPHEHIFIFGDVFSRPFLTRYPVRAGVGIDYQRVRAAVSIDQSAEFDWKIFDFLFFGGEASYLRDTQLGPEWAASGRVSITWSSYKPKSQEVEVEKEVKRTPIH